MLSHRPVGLPVQDNNWENVRSVPQTRQNKILSFDLSWSKSVSTICGEATASNGLNYTIRLKCKRIKTFLYLKHSRPKPWSPWQMSTFSRYCRLRWRQISQITVWLEWYVCHIMHLTRLMRLIPCIYICLWNLLLQSTTNKRSSWNFFGYK